MNSPMSIVSAPRGRATAPRRLGDRDDWLGDSDCRFANACKGHLDATESETAAARVPTSVLGHNGATAARRLGSSRQKLPDATAARRHPEIEAWSSPVRLVETTSLQRQLGAQEFETGCTCGTSTPQRSRHHGIVRQSRNRQLDAKEIETSSSSSSDSKASISVQRQLDASRSRPRRIGHTAIRRERAARRPRDRDASESGRHLGAQGHLDAEEFETG